MAIAGKPITSNLKPVYVDCSLVKVLNKIVAVKVSDKEVDNNH